MQIFHPNQNVHGLPPENVFYVADEAGRAQGEGVVIPGYRPDLFPDRPVTVFMNIKAQGSWRDILLGACLARVQQIREEHPELKARAYAQVNAQDAETLSFYLGSGFDRNDGADIVQLSMPSVRPAVPMGYAMGLTPVDNQNTQLGLLGRMNPYRLTPWSLQQLQKFITMPNFLAMNITKGSAIVGEIVTIGRGDSARIVGLYIQPEYRRKELAKILIACSMKRLMENGVKIIEGEVIRRSALQVHLAECCDATFRHTALLYPGIDYD